MVKRGVVDILRRGLDNTLANWPVILLRLGESILFAILAGITIVVIVLPLILSIGISFDHIETIDNVADAILDLRDAWVLLVWIFLVLSVLLAIIVVVHSYVEAGCARMAVAGDRKAGPPMEGQRSRFHVFRMGRWMDGAREGFWPVFWIYNLIWGIGGLVLMIPLIPTALLMMVLRENPVAMSAIALAGLMMTIFFGIVTGFVMSMWSNRAIAGWTARRQPVREAVASSWRAMRLDLPRHVLIALALIVVGMAGSSFLGSMSFFAAIGNSFSETAIVGIVTMPLRMLAWLLSAAFSAAVSTWFLASYAAIAVEKQGSQYETPALSTSPR